MTKNIQWNWFHFLALANLFCFGLYGGFTTQREIAIQAAFTLYFLLLGVLALKLADQTLKWGERSQITHRDFWVFLGSLAVLLPLSWEYLVLPLQKDQIAHAQQSAIHGLMALRFLFDQGLISGEHTYASLYHVVGFIALTLLVIWIWTFQKLGPRGRIVLWSFTFLTLRAAVFIGGGNPDPHPPLRLLPATLMGWIGGLSSPVFRFSSYLFLCYFAVMMFRWARKSMSSRKAFIFSVACVSLPLIWHTGVVVEVSVIATLGYSLLLMSLLQFSWKEFPFERWLALTAIFCLARVPFVFAYVPLMIIAVKRWKMGILELSSKTALTVVASVGLVLPHFLSAVFVGTGSKFSALENNPLTSDPSLLNRVAFAFREGVMAQGIYDNFFGLWWILVIPFLIALGAIVRRVRRKWGRDCAWIVLILAPVLIVSFYGVKPKYWGVPRYVAEFAAPFYVAGLYTLVQWLRRWPFGHWMALAICAYNFWIFSDLPKYNPTSDERISMATEIGTRALSETVYDYDRAFQEARIDNFAGKSYVVGTTYGTFLEILNGFTFQEIKQSQEILKGLYNEERKWVANFREPASADAIHNNLNVQLVLFSDLPRLEIEQGLLARDWLPWQVYINPRFGSTLRGYRRPDQ